MSATVNIDMESIPSWKTPSGVLRRTWYGMIRRCHRPGEPSYDRYGGRGITVCERWHVFENFLADMGYRPSAAHSIDRYPDNDGNYEPGNCRWATASEQRANQCYSYYVLYGGHPLTIREFTALTKMPTRDVFAAFKDGSLVECCKEGHPFTSDNIYVHLRYMRKVGVKYRACRTCRYLANKKAYLKLRDQIGLPPPRPSKLVRPPKYLKCPHPAMSNSSDDLGVKP